MFDSGKFILSLDFELIWGTVDKRGPGMFRAVCEKERAEIIDRLLALFVEFKLSATWCIVGHLFLDHCDGKHAEIVAPHHAWVSGNWFDRDPGTDETRDPIFYGRELVRKIRSCPVRQEIGCHSFSHVIFNDPGCTREVADSEIRACLRLAREAGIELESFAFPRNLVGHLDVLADHGFLCYRGPEPRWYEDLGLPKTIRRAARLLEVMSAAVPPVSYPEQEPNGLWNIPGSMMYFPMNGVRRNISLSLRMKRAIRGLEAAARQRKVFHLWFHPTNLADSTEDMFDGLRAILEHATAMQRAGVLQMNTMAQVARSAALVTARRPHLAAEATHAGYGGDLQDDVSWGVPPSLAPARPSLASRLLSSGMEFLRRAQPKPLPEHPPAPGDLLGQEKTESRAGA